MTTSVGFILLTHQKSHQIFKLIDTLNQMFDRPPIVCHHDFSKSILPTEGLTENVSLVQPHIETGWGRFSIIEAELAAFSLMCQRAIPPDWFIVLSGADYPIKPAKQILNDLASSSYDVHMQYEYIDSNPDADRSAWQDLCYLRYYGVRFRIPSFDEKLRLSSREITLIKSPLRLPFLPYSKRFRCFAGEHWFCANRKAIEYLLKFHKSKPPLASHMRRMDAHVSTIVPDESYYHTVFCNAAHLKVSNNNWRYIDWSAKGAHPKVLKVEDLPKIRESSAHFARKLDMDVDMKIFNEIDAIL
jgi:hypothetical protein